MNVLVVATHPDDEVLGCGGTIARLAKEGHAVYIAILAEGITSRYNTPDQAPDEQVEALHSRAEQVGALLEARDVYLYGLPDNRMDCVPLLDVVKIIEQLIDNLKPEVVYIQHGGDLNIDHVTLYRAALTATRPMQGCTVKAVYAYEVASSTEWAFQQFAPGFQPNVFVDVTNTLELKIQAMQLYESEARKYPHPRSPEALRAQAMRWGATVGVHAAEAFQLVRSIS